MIQAAKRKARGFNTLNSNSLSLTLSKYSYPLKRE